tara:strand:+ start:1037 stop:1204 length:168 start_codon:yes stop_codon:yes gene_type:complete
VKIIDLILLPFAYLGFFLACFSGVMPMEAPTTKQYRLIGGFVLTLFASLTYRAIA